MALRRFRDSNDGATAVMTGMISVMAAGAAALAIDIGQLSVLKNQMQNYADASAMAAAVHLDQSPGARARAEDVARNAAARISGVPVDDKNILVDSVQFYSSFGASPTVATTDEEARFIEVKLQQRQVNYLFQPVLNFVFGSGDKPDHGFVSAEAVAGSDPFVCHAPPLMICDPEEGDPTLSLDDPANKGRQFRLKLPLTGGGTWVPGNFGLLQVPDEAGGAGASAISEALKAVSPTGCYKLVVDTATGSKTNQVKDGINARFDIGIGDEPAPNVKNYPRDIEIQNDPDATHGSGDWDPAAYWTDRHGGSLPAELTDASRYQVYLYELGLEFGRDGGDTLYPIPEGGAPGNYTVITPPGENLPVAQGSEDPTDPYFDGVPQNSPASNGYARRLVQVAILQCIADDVKGTGTYPTQGNFAEFFITEQVNDAPDGGIMGEFVRKLTTTTAPDFHANVRLVK